MGRQSGRGDIHAEKVEQLGDRLGLEDLTDAPERMKKCQRQVATPSEIMEPVGRTGPPLA